MRLRNEFPGFQIAHDRQLAGRYSKVNRQIDVLLESKVLDYPIRGVVDCKSYAKKVDVKVIDSFIGFMADTDAQIGIIFTNEGFTEAAQNRAEHDPLSIHLEIVTHSELKEWKFDRMALAVPTTLGALENASESAEGIRIVEYALGQYFDAITPRFQNLLREMPPAQIKVIDALSQEPFEKDVAAISKVTMLSPPQVSVYLERLMKSGHVRRRHLVWRISNPEFAIWHLLRFSRNQRSIISQITAFLQHLADKRNYRDASFMSARYPSIKTKAEQGGVDNG